MKEPKEKNELLEIWTLALWHFPDCRNCFPKGRKLRYLRKKKPNHICFDKRKVFWQVKAKMDDIKKQLLSMKEIARWFYQRGMEYDEFLSPKDTFEEKWKKWSHGLKKGEKRG